MFTLKVDGVGEKELGLIISGLCRAGNCQLPVDDLAGRKQFAIDEIKTKVQEVLQAELVDVERLKAQQAFSEAEDKIEESVQESLKALDIKGETTPDTTPDTVSDTPSIP